jgi:DNA-binding IclR family transcriptional regulator
MPGLQANLTNISKSVGISKSKAYAILNTLQRFGFVIRDSDTKHYSLGLYMMTIGQKVMENVDYRELSGPFLKELARKTNSTAFLGLIDSNNRFIIARQESTRRINIIAQSDRTYPLTFGAHGKAIVAFLESEEREKILSEKSLYFHQDPELFNRDLLLKELEECRLSGFASDHDTGYPIIKILAAPFFDANEKPLGTIQIIGLLEEKEIAAHGAMLVETARRFSRMFIVENSEIVTKSSKGE